MLEYGSKKRSNRQQEAGNKILPGALARIAGGDRIEDVEALRADKGLVGSLGWEGIVGADAYGNFLQERRGNGKLRKVNEAVVIKAMAKSGGREFTYDNDATYFDSEKRSAGYSYQKRRQHSGLIGCIAELGLINTVDFRRGEISPATGIYD